MRQDRRSKGRKEAGSAHPQSSIEGEQEEIVREHGFHVKNHLHTTRFLLYSPRPFPRLVSSIALRLSLPLPHLTVPGCARLAYAVLPRSLLCPLLPCSPPPPHSVNFSNSKSVASRTPSSDTKHNEGHQISQHASYFDDRYLPPRPRPALLTSQPQLWEQRNGLSSLSYSPAAGPWLCVFHGRGNDSTPPVVPPHGVSRASPAHPPSVSSHGATAVTSVSAVRICDHLPHSSSSSSSSSSAGTCFSCAIISL
eukprot:765306-Hanusia_phi.AAC.4